MTKNEYHPDLAETSPGATAADLMSEQRLSYAETARCLGWELAELTAFLDGSLRLTYECAQDLERVFKVPAYIWMVLDHSYRNRRRNIQHLANQCLQICKQEDWALDWNARGCYMHLEVSELIEALRGKGDTTVTQEAADVLFTVLTTIAAEEIPVSDVLEALADICESYLKPSDTP